MAWCCLPSSRNEEVSACTPTEKRRGGKEWGRRRVRHRKDREKEKREEGTPLCTGTALADSRERGAGTRGSGTRDSGAPRIRRKKKHRVNDPTRRAVARGIKSRSELYCTLSHRLPSGINDVADGGLCAINENFFDLITDIALEVGSRERSCKHQYQNNLVVRVSINKNA